MTLRAAFTVTAPSADGRSDLWFELIEANGCRLSSELASPMVPAAGFTSYEPRAVTRALFAKGSIPIDRETDTLMPMTEGCR